MRWHFKGFPRFRKFALLFSAVCVASTFLVKPAYSATLIWVGDFETGDLSQYSEKIPDDKVGYVKVVTSPVRDGKYAAEMTVFDSNLVSSSRAELVSKNRGSGNIKFLWDGPEYWIGVSMYFKEWAAQGHTFFQVHAPNEGPGSSCDYAGNAFTIRPTGSNINLEDTLSVAVLDNPSGRSEAKGASSNNKVVDSMPIPIGKWIDFVAHFRLSTKGEGFFEVWKDGKMVYSEYNMTNVNWIDSCGNPIPPEQQMHNGLHVGIYASKTKQYRRIFVDELRVAEGAGSNGYDLVAPKGNGAASPIVTAPPSAPSFL